MEWQLEDAPHGPHVLLGYLKEAPGMAAHPGTAWPCLDLSLEVFVTMPPRLVTIEIVGGIKQ